jgi:hypothetical protein
VKTTTSGGIEIDGDVGTYGGAAYTYTGVVATSMVPATHAAGAIPGNIVFTQTLDTALISGDKIVITTTGTEIFAADTDCSCTVSDDVGSRAVTSSASVGGIVTIVMGAVLNAGTAITITCGANLSPNGNDGSTRVATVKTTNTGDV